MVCLGLEPGTAEWLAQTIQLSYSGSLCSMKSSYLTFQLTKKTLLAVVGDLMVSTFTLYMTIRIRIPPAGA